MDGNLFALVIVVVWKIIKGIVIGLFKLIVWMFSNLMLLLGLALVGLMIYAAALLFL